MKNLLFLALGLIVYMVVDAQTTRSKRHKKSTIPTLQVPVIVTAPQPLPKLKIYQIPAPLPGDAMEYRFPDTVMDCLNAAILNRADKCLLQFDSKGDTILLRIVDFSIPRTALKDTGFRSLIAATNRYCNILGERVPVYFSSDDRFSFINWSYNDGFFIRFIARNWADDHGCKILSVGYY